MQNSPDIGAFFGHVDGQREMHLMTADKDPSEEGLQGYAMEEAQNQAKGAVRSGC